MAMGPQELYDPTAVEFLKMLLAMILGGVIGTERAVVARQAAGTRTFGLVSLGACMFIIAGNYVDSHYLGVVNLEPLQIAGAIVTGIGFIGGGLIVFRGGTLHGATTAAGLWIATAIGISTGFGMYAIAIFATILTLIMFTGMWFVENRFKHWFIEHREEHTAENNPAL